MIGRVQRWALQLWRRLPRALRRRIVRFVAPSYTVGAMCLIERADGKLLLVQQVYRRNWGVPGGLVKRGEDIADCAHREVYEEVGLRIELVGEPAVVVDAPPQRVDVIYRARPAEGEDPTVLSPQSPEIRQTGWFDLEELPPLQHEAVGALVALARASGHHARLLRSLDRLGWQAPGELTA